MRRKHLVRYQPSAGRSAFVAALAAFLPIGSSLIAAPPENSDSSLAGWFQSLVSPTGGSCCSLSDCRPVDVRMGSNAPVAGMSGYEVLIVPQQFPIQAASWVPVPKAKVISPKGNPVGRAVVCWSPYYGVMCFVRPPET